MTSVLIFCMRVLEVLFMVGLAGSAIVVAISFVEDIGVLFERDRPRREAISDREPGYQPAAPYRASNSSAGA